MVLEELLIRLLIFRMIQKNKIPYDFYASLETKEWRKNFKSSINELDLNSFFLSQEERILSYIESLSCDKKKNLVLLCLPLITSRFNEILIATIMLKEGDNLGIEYVSKIPEVRFLKNGIDFIRDKKIKTEPRFLFIRRIIRTLSWTKWYQFLSVFKTPDIVAISHNSTLRKYAKCSNEKIYFIQASELLRKIDSGQVKETHNLNITEISNDIYYVLLNDCIIESTYQDRFNKLAHNLIIELLENGFDDLEKCYSYDKFPSTIWTATPQEYFSRLFALSSLYHNGSSVGFSHSTTPIIAGTKNYSLINELSVTSSYVCMSKKSKNLISTTLTKKINPTLLYVDGDSMFENINSKVIFSDIPCVVYVNGAIKDLSRGTVLINSMSYLEWQLRVSDFLDKLNINLIVQPHPEGVFKDLSIKHPLLSKYNQEKRKFEDIMHQADVFLIDAANSSAFGMMLLTNKPVVLFDFYGEKNGYKSRPEVRKIIDKRCRVIDIHYNNNTNLPYFDYKSLSEALTMDWRESVDSSEIEELLLNKKI